MEGLSEFFHETFWSGCWWWWRNSVVSKACPLEWGFSYHCLHWSSNWWSILERAYQDLQFQMMGNFLAKISKHLRWKEVILPNTTNHQRISVKVRLLLHTSSLEWNWTMYFTKSIPTSTIWDVALLSSSNTTKQSSFAKYHSQPA